jgi:hypothetical protein
MISPNSRRAVIVAFVLLALLTLSARAEVPTPEQFFGFKIGADKKLARYDKIVEYFKLLASRTDRVRVRTLGPTTLGNPFILVEISSADTIKELDHYKALERKLYFQGGAPTDAERDEILKTGKSVILNTNNIHSPEIGSSQEAILLGYKLATENSPRVQNILDNDILLLVPSLNPDGQQLVVDWYNKYLDTPFETSQTPFLWHPYAGHDDNRDEYLFSQRESRLIADVLWHDWFPTIWLDEHQQGNNGARIFTMPARDPINPNVDPLIYRLTTVYGQQQAAALEAEGKEGITYSTTYTNFWPGAMAWTGWWHNQVGLLTEVASARLATPVYQRKAEITVPDASGGNAAAGRAAGGGREASGAGPAAATVARDVAAGGPGGPGGPGGFDANGNAGSKENPLPAPTDTISRLSYPRPWLGGEWRLSDIIDYEFTATLALLDTAANNRATLLSEIYETNRRTINAGANGEIGLGKDRNYAALIPVAGQQDNNEVTELIDKLLIGGIEISRATQEFQQDGATYAAGTYVIPFNQVFGRYVKDLLEKQHYPEVRPAPNAPAEAPYDVSAWSLGLQFGVKTVYAKTPLAKDIQLEKVPATPKFVLNAEKISEKKLPGWKFAYNGAESAVVLNRLLKSGAKTSFAQSAAGDATFVLVNTTAANWNKATAGFDVNLDKLAATSGSPTEIHQPRVALYQAWTANMDEGWTRWVFDHYEFPYTSLHNKDVQAGKLHDRFDVIVLPDARATEILEGRTGKGIPEEYRGGIGDAGWKTLEDFVHDGGTLVALGEASSLIVNKLPLPVKDINRTLTRDEHFAPGTIVNLQVNTTNPLGFGVAQNTYGFYINSPFFEITDGFSNQKVQIVARYPNEGANASGWLRGEEFHLGKAAVVTVDLNPGKVVLFGIRPQHRAQTHATFPLLFNALYWSTERAPANSATAASSTPAQHGLN